MKKVVVNIIIIIIVIIAFFVLGEKNQEIGIFKYYIDKKLDAKLKF